jgi:general secretion pathway protein K
MKRERGVAAITALLIVAVAASTATFMLSQHSAMLDQTALVAARAQAELYGDAGLDWARGVLAEDARRAGSVDFLGEGWAQPIAGIPVERAVVSGLIDDEQGKMNLNNLVIGGRSDADFRILQRLLRELALPPELADAVLDWIDADEDLTGTGGAESAYYLSLKRPYRAANQLLAQVDELYRVRGFDAATVAKLRPHVTALPVRTSININTASGAVLAAVFDGKVPREALEARIAARREKPFQSPNEIAQWAPKADARVTATDLGVRSDFFSVRVQVAQDDVRVAAEALVQRAAQGGNSTVLWRRAIY